MANGKKYTKIPKRIKYRVRCLGPVEVGEHYFDSADKTSERICPKCRLRLNWQRIPRILEHPCKVHAE